MLLLFATHRALSFKHASELAPLTYAAIATRMSLLQGKGCIQRVEPLPGRHIFERPYAITERGLQRLADHEWLSVNCRRLLDATHCAS